jgi:hypothetical protein
VRSLDATLIGTAHNLFSMFLPAKLANMHSLRCIQIT